MGSILRVLGILLIIGGIFGTIFGFTQGIGSTISSVVDMAENPEELAGQYCEEGEELESETGSQTYSQTTGYGRDVFYYCVGEDGERRDITDDFGFGMIDNAMGSVTGMLPSIGIGVLSGCAIPLGVIFLVISLFTGGGKKKNTPMSAFGGGGGVILKEYSSGTQSTSTSTTRSTTNESIEQRLKAIEDLRARDLISEEEYQKLRRKILDGMN
jgi:hypothetical protein